MPTFRIDSDGKFVPFEPKKAEELEAELENWLEQNDHVLFSPENVLYIGRQVTTDLNKTIDLLAVDSQRRPIIIELKKDRTPRDMMAQALEYAAFVRKLDYDALNSISVPYFGRCGQPWDSLADAHRETFGEQEESAWNPEQIVVLVGQTVQPELVDVARFLRDHNIDVRVLQFVYLESSSGERLVNVQSLVGGEKLPKDAGKTTTQPMPTLEEALLRTPAVKQIFEELMRLFEQAGVYPREERTLRAFDLTRNGQPIMNIWPSPAGRVIVLILGKRAGSLGDLDAFQTRIQAAGFFTRRGRTDMSIHVYPGEEGKLAELVNIFKQSFLMKGASG